MNTPDVWYGGAWGSPDKVDDIFNVGGNRITSGGDGKVGTIPTLFDTLQPIETPSAPSISMPTIDTNRIASLTQEFASPSIRAGRNALRETLAGGSRSNPVLRSYQTRGAVTGFGDVVEKAVGGARQPAVSLANQELQSNIDTQKTNANMQWAKTLMDYNEKLRLRNLQIDERRRAEDLQTKKEEEERKIILQRQSGRGGFNFIRPSIDNTKPFSSYEEDFNKSRAENDTNSWKYDPLRGWVPPNSNISQYQPSQYELNY